METRPGFERLLIYLGDSFVEYLYLLFSDDKTVPLEENIFNTEVSVESANRLVRLADRPSSLTRPTSSRSLRRRVSRSLLEARSRPSPDAEAGTRVEYEAIYLPGC